MSDPASMSTGSNLGGLPQRDISIGRRAFETASEASSKCHIVAVYTALSPRVPHLSAEAAEEDTYPPPLRCSRGSGLTSP